MDPGGQLLPGAAVDKTRPRILFPVSGLSTVTVPVMVTVWPTGMSPVHDAPVAVTTIVPEEAVWSPSEVALAKTSDGSVATVIPV